MKRLVILGHGTGGTIIATKMRQVLPESQWHITVIDKDWQHHYQPGWLFTSAFTTWRTASNPRRTLWSKGSTWSWTKSLK
jgi:NADH dehydrogenase FAD-containing subunit